MKEHEHYGSCGECGVELTEPFAALSDDGWKQRCEQLEVVAEALYRGHKDGRELFNTYRSVYLSTSDDDTTWKPTEDEPFPY